MIAIFLGKKIEILKYSFIEDLIYSVALKQRQKTMTVLDSFYFLPSFMYKVYKRKDLFLGLFAYSSILIVCSVCKLTL